MMSMAFFTVGNAMNYVEDTIGEELEKTALKSLGNSIAKHKGKAIGTLVGLPVVYSLFQSAREADREAGGIPQALDDAMDGVDSGLDEVDRVMDEGFSDKQKALAALGALGLAGVGGYKAYKSLSGREKVSTDVLVEVGKWAKKNPKMSVPLGLLMASPIVTLPYAIEEAKKIKEERQRQLAEEKEKKERERRNKELAALATTGLIAGAGGYALGKSALDKSMGSEKKKVDL